MKPYRSIIALTFLLFTLGIFAFQTTEKKKNKSVKSTSNSSLPMGSWMHSHEEDENKNSDWKTYRTSTYSFPPARGRSGFILLKENKIGLIHPSPVDGRDTTWGTWALTKTPGILDISFSKAPLTHFEASRKSKEIWLVKMW